MDGLRTTTHALIIASLLVTFASAGFVGSATIRAPAVILYNNTGSITNITLTVTTGNGTVRFTSPENIGSSTMQSARTAAQYASKFTNTNINNYTFTYTIHDNQSNVSGPSAGAAMTLLAISALDHAQLRNDFTITGTISSDGSIGAVGGVIDKVGAAAASRLKLALVPAAAPGSLEDGIYFVAQTEYGIPLVQVRNITQALNFATNPALAGYSNETKLNLSSGYDTSAVQSQPQALECSNNCNMTPFAALSNYTAGITSGQIANLSTNQNFSSVAHQLSDSLAISQTLSTKGYFYTAANIDFLNYLNALYLSSYKLDRNASMDYMLNVEDTCSGIVSPDLTQANYDYVLGAELRQGWGNYTINSTLSAYNISEVTNDDILSSMYTTGQAEAWCNAASYIYDYPYQTSNLIAFSPSKALKDLAFQRLKEASTPPGMYLAIAQQAYRQMDYPIAIYDADYAYSLSNSSSKFSENASTLTNAAEALAHNSTYGVWGTEYASSALFYVQQSRASQNATKAEAFAQQAYQTAVLANLFSSDAKVINESVVVSAQVQGQQSGHQPQTGLSNDKILGLYAYINTVNIFLMVVLVLLVANLALLCIFLSKLSKLKQKQPTARRRRRRAS